MEVSQSPPCAPVKWCTIYLGKYNFSQFLNSKIYQGNCTALILFHYRQKKPLNLEFMKKWPKYESQCCHEWIHLKSFWNAFSFLHLFPVKNTIELTFLWRRTWKLHRIIFLNFVRFSISIGHCNIFLRI